MTQPEIITLDSSIFPLDTIKKTALRYTGSYWVSIEPGEGSMVRVTLSPKASPPFEPHLIRQFHHDLLDQDLRAIVANETELATRLILAQAFSRLTGSSDSEPEASSPALPE